VSRLAQNIPLLGRFSLAVSGSFLLSAALWFGSLHVFFGSVAVINIIVMFLLFRCSLLAPSLLGWGCFAILVILVILFVFNFLSSRGSGLLGRWSLIIVNVFLGRPSALPGSWRFLIVGNGFLGRSARLLLGGGGLLFAVIVFRRSLRLTTTLLLGLLLGGFITTRGGLVVVRGGFLGLLCCLGFVETETVLTWAVLLWILGGVSTF
jgi:hypothetical protein